MAHNNYCGNFLPYYCIFYNFAAILTGRLKNKFVAGYAATN